MFPILVYFFYGLTHWRACEDEEQARDFQYNSDDFIHKVSSHVFVLGFSFFFLDPLLLVKLRMRTLFMLSLGMLPRGLLQYLFSTRQIILSFQIPRLFFSIAIDCSIVEGVRDNGSEMTF